jgi:hypothetical protein
MKVERDATRLTRDFYLRKVAELQVKIKDLEKTNEILRRTLNQKEQMIEFLR